MDGVNGFYHSMDGLTRYGKPILATWREALKRKTATLDDVPFSKEDIVRHSEYLTKLNVLEKALNLKNTPDIIYSFRAREELPAEILKNGHYAIVGRGKGLYSFVRIPRQNRVPIVTGARRVPIRNQIPQRAIKYLGVDEQAMLTNIRVNDVVALHLSLKTAFQLQAHLRKGIPNYGQIELDALYVGESEEGNIVFIGVEAKDSSEHDRLNISQLFGSARALQELFPDGECRLLGAKAMRDGTILMSEFAVADHPADLKPVGSWVNYVFTRR